MTASLPLPNRLTLSVTHAMLESVSALPRERWNDAKIHHFIEQSLATLKLSRDSVDISYIADAMRRHTERGI